MAADEENVTGSGDNIADQTDSEVPVTQSFSIEVLQLIKEAQQQHGLRHGDHQRYRSYCSRKIRRLRKSLHFAQGTKHKVAPKKITLEMLSDEKYIHLPLFEAERAWGFAMQLKSESNTEPRKKFHMIARLRKALQHANELVKLCESPKCDARTKLESQAYNAWIQGSLHFETDNWQNAIDSFSNAKTIYEKLATAFTEDIQVLYQQRVEEISPNIRYCAYKIGDESALKDLQNMRLKSGEDQLISKLDDLLLQTREKQASTLSEVAWRGRTIPVKMEGVRNFLLNLQDSTTELKSAEGSDSKLSIYESLFKQCIDAQQLLRDALQEDPIFKAAIRGQPIDGKISNQHYLHTYLTYIKLTKTIERNLILIECAKENLPGVQVDESKKITKPQDMVRLYDIIIQNLSDIPNLPGLEDDSALEEEVNTRVLGYKAFRTFYIGKSYANGMKWTEAIALYQKSLDYTKQALQGYKKLKGQEIFRTEESKLNELVKEVNGVVFSCHASSILNVAGDLTDQPVSKPSLQNVSLSDRLDQYSEDKSIAGKKPNLTKFPPDFQPIPTRPLFFDLALNHLDLPSLEDKLDQKKTAAGGTGITGFVKGWLWGGGKK
ncbi:hypothetical protein SNE40_005802 [Patella caerulea]|uniref:Signal recognition particle subunit SRP68 n=1 Tax=Patella caerulea TaxID=87958 RepID=A0AAN8Q545_PATCE